MIAAASKPPAVLVVNPNAGRLSENVRTQVIDAFRARFDAKVLATSGRNTGIELARDAAHDGAQLIVAFGGDGHVNEVANGVARTSAALGIIPGGTMNVFARQLGVPLNPLEAVERLRANVGGATRMVPLGRMNDRLFTFSAGCGFDAEAAERVERYVPNKRRFGEVFFYWSAFRVLAGSYRQRNPSMVLRGSFGEVPVAMAIACNAGPYAYLFDRPVTIAPDVRLDGGLDIFALRSMRLEALPLYAWRAVVTHDFVHHPDAFYASDLESFELEAEEPVSRHVDGEPLTPSTTIRFAIERDILDVLV